VVQRHSSGRDLLGGRHRLRAPTDGKGPFIAIYELDCDDLDSVVQRLGELGASGKMSSLELLNMETPPIPKVYGQIGFYTK
jgi:hypothetical protein